MTSKRPSGNARLMAYLQEATRLPSLANREPAGAIRRYDQQIVDGQEPYDYEMYEDGFEFDMKHRERKAQDQLEEIKGELESLLEE